MGFVQDILSAMSAESIPYGSQGLWSVAPLFVKDSTDGVAAGLYTRLSSITMASAHTPPGETVMIDHLPELRTHLEFILRAQGRVLVCGLGLGCVVRGLLANPNVTRVDVIERSADVLSLVAPHMPRDRRLKIHVGDAREIDIDGEWDDAGHDLWSDGENDPHLHVMHAQTMHHWHKRVGRQFAWQFPRHQRRLWDRVMMGGVA